MKLTTEEIIAIYDNSTPIRDSTEVVEFARAVIAENNKKVLADLKPIFEQASIVNYALPKQTYSADTVSALIQERDALAARVKDLGIALEAAQTVWQDSSY